MRMNFQSPLKYALISALLILPPTLCTTMPAIAGTVSGAQITMILSVQGPNEITGHDGKFFYYVNTNITASPACAAGQPERYALDPGTDGGKAMIALVMTAYAQGKPITVEGANVCDIWSDTETTNWVGVGPIPFL